MKRFIQKTTTLLVAVAISFTACKKDTANMPASTSIVGTWQLTNYHEVDVDSTTNPVTVNSKDTVFVLILKFNSDNSAVSYNDIMQSFGNPGAYTLYGNDSISYSFGPGPPPVIARYTIQGTILTFFTQPHYLYDPLHYFTSTQTFRRLK
jgi:hypothetical protein